MGVKDDMGLSALLTGWSLGFGCCGCECFGGGVIFKLLRYYCYTILFLSSMGITDFASEVKWEEMVSVN